MINQENPLLTEWNTLFNAPPFDIIQPVHFKEAVKDAEMQQIITATNGQIQRQRTFN